jgi:hypothetical protein
VLPGLRRVIAPGGELDKLGAGAPQLLAPEQLEGRVLSLTNWAKVLAVAAPLASLGGAVSALTRAVGADSVAELVNAALYVPCGVVVLPLAFAWYHLRSISLAIDL